jgi:Outer membrane protein Omp28
MKKLVLGLCCALALLAGCKENDAPVVYSAPAKDSVYHLAPSAIPAADPHNALAEEFTGQSCSNCPAAHTALESDALGGQVNIIGMYILSSNFTQTWPLDNTTLSEVSLYDLRDSFATDISNSVYGNVESSGIPSGGIDRIPINSGSLLGHSGDWSVAIAGQKSVVDSVNLGLESSYEGGVVTIKATITYLKDMATKQNLTVVITEDSVFDWQESFPTNIASYRFMDVCRGRVSNQSIGDPILDTMAVKKAGTVYWRKYTYTPKLASASTAAQKKGIVDVNHCHVVAYVNSPGVDKDFHVLQSWKVKMVP